MVVIAPKMMAGIIIPLVAHVNGGNPLVPNVGMADPHIHYFNGKVYLYATHDFAANDTSFVMKDWWVWSSPDFVHWDKESVVPPMSWNLGERNSCWATDGAERDGKYFFYLSVGPTEVGVVTSDSPGGPWTDPLGKPLLSSDLGNSLKPPTQIRDPGILTDGNSSYIVFGTFNYYIAKLNPDMISLAEAPRYITIDCPPPPETCGQNGPNKTDDKPFLFVREGTYYLSWGAWYGISKSPYGPFKVVGTFIDPNLLAPDFRVPDIHDKPWYQQPNYKDRHGGFMELNGQWYFSMNDLSHSTDKNNPNYFRDSVISYVHFNDNSTIAPLVVNATGVGQYNAMWHIEAENFYEISGKGRAREIRQGEIGFEVSGLTNGSALKFPNVRNVLPDSSLFVRARHTETESKSSTILNIFFNGRLAARCVVESSRSDYIESECEKLGKHSFASSGNLELTVSVEGESLLAIDRLEFN